MKLLKDFDKNTPELEITSAMLDAKPSPSFSESFVLAQTSAYWLLYRGFTEFGCKLLFGARSAPCVSHPPWTIGLAGADLHREMSQMQESKPNNWHISSLFALSSANIMLVEPKKR